jgi:hypothetical protein
MIHVFSFGSQACPFKRLAEGEGGVVGVVGVEDAGVEWAELAALRLGVEEREPSLVRT